MICLNGVEALVNNRCSDLAAVVMFRAGGRPLHSRMCSEDPEVRALSVLLCSVLSSQSAMFSSLLLHNHHSQSLIYNTAFYHWTNFSKLHYAAVNGQLYKAFGCTESKAQALLNHINAVK